MASDDWPVGAIERTSGSCRITPIAAELHAINADTELTRLEVGAICPKFPIAETPNVFVL
jgi:hypothetical protein